MWNDTLPRIHRALDSALNLTISLGFSAVLLNMLAQACGLIG